MNATARIDELRHKHAEHPRRYFAPLGNALRQAGALDEAIALLRDGLAAYPAHLSGHVVLGQALFEAGALNEARETFEHAATLDAGNLIVLRHLGEIARLRGDDEAAREWFSRLRTADPYANDVAVQLGGEELPVVAGGVIEATGAVMTPTVPSTAITTMIAPEMHEPSEAQRVAPGAFELFEPIDFDPVVGLDVVPPEPLPEPIREQLDVLFEEAPIAVTAPEAVQSPSTTSPSAVGASPFDVVAVEDAADVEESSDSMPVPAAPFVTETMAKLLLSQGHADEALAVYEQLLAQRPEDPALRARVDEVRGAVDGAAAHELPGEAVAASEATPPAAEPFDAEIEFVTPAAHDAAAGDVNVTLAAQTPAADESSVRPADDRAAAAYAAAVNDERAEQAVASVEARASIEAPHVSAPTGSASAVIAMEPTAGAFFAALEHAEPGAAPEALPPTPGETAASHVTDADARAAEVLRVAFATPLTEATSHEAPLGRAESAAVDSSSAPSVSPPLRDAVAMASATEPMGEADPFADLSFDRFFPDAGHPTGADPIDRAGDGAAAAPAAPPHATAETPAVSPATAAPDAVDTGTEDDDDEDLARFNAWLRGLAE